VDIAVPSRSKLCLVPSARSHVGVLQEGRAAPAIGSEPALLDEAAQGVSDPSGRTWGTDHEHLPTRSANVVPTGAGQN
jgi:hypothetical protein